MNRDIISPLRWHGRPDSRLSRRDFIKGTVLGFTSLAFFPIQRLIPLVQFPETERLGRVTVGMAEVKTKPDADSATVSKVYEDAVVP
jgi:hypothetical protein